MAKKKKKDNDSDIGKATVDNITQKSRRNPDAMLNQTNQGAQGVKGGAGGAQGGTINNPNTPWNEAAEKGGAGGAQGGTINNPNTPWNEAAEKGGANATTGGEAAKPNTRSFASVFEKDWWNSGQEQQRTVPTLNYGDITVQRANELRRRGARFVPNQQAGKYQVMTPRESMSVGGHGSAVGQPIGDTVQTKSDRIRQAIRQAMAQRGLMGGQGPAGGQGQRGEQAEATDQIRQDRLGWVQNYITNAWNKDDFDTVRHGFDLLDQGGVPVNEYNPEVYRLRRRLEGTDLFPRERQMVQQREQELAQQQRAMLEERDEEIDERMGELLKDYQYARSQRGESGEDMIQNTYKQALALVGGEPEKLPAQFYEIHREVEKAGDVNEVFEPPIGDESLAGETRESLYGDIEIVMPWEQEESPEQRAKREAAEQKREAAEQKREAKQSKKRERETATLQAGLKNFVAAEGEDKKQIFNEMRRKYDKGDLMQYPSFQSVFRMLDQGKDIGEIFKPHLGPKEREEFEAETRNSILGNEVKVPEDYKQPMSDQKTVIENKALPSLDYSYYKHKGLSGSDFQDLITTGNENYRGLNAVAKQIKESLKAHAKREGVKPGNRREFVERNAFQILDEQLRQLAPEIRTLYYQDARAPGYVQKYARNTVIRGRRSGQPPQGRKADKGKGAEKEPKPEADQFDAAYRDVYPGGE